MRNPAISTLILLLLVLIFATCQKCTTEPAPGSGKIMVHLTDAPANFDMEFFSDFFLIGSIIIFVILAAC